MTIPPSLSPTAGLFNALVRLLNSRYRARIHELEAAIVAEHAHNRTADPLAWVDDRIQHRPAERHAWRPLKRLMAADSVEAPGVGSGPESTVNERSVS